jgi:hypothetical protein
MISFPVSRTIINAHFGTAPTDGLYISGVTGKTKDNYFSEIKVTQEKSVKLVADGKLDAVTATKKIG